MAKKTRRAGGGSAWLRAQAQQRAAAMGDVVQQTEDKNRARAEQVATAIKDMLENQVKQQQRLQRLAAFAADQTVTIIGLRAQLRESFEANAKLHTAQGRKAPAKKVAKKSPAKRPAAKRNGRAMNQPLRSNIDKEPKDPLGVLQPTGKGKGVKQPPTPGAAPGEKGG